MAPPRRVRLCLKTDNSGSCLIGGSRIVMDCRQSGRFLSRRDFPESPRTFDRGGVISIGYEANNTWQGKCLPNGRGGTVSIGKRGFSLIELLIVVAIILVIAAIAIPNLIRARIAANESSAVSTLRVLNTAEVTYAMTYGSG